MSEGFPNRIPTIIETTIYGERGFDLYARLLQDRIIFLDREIDEAAASLATAQLLFLQHDDAQRDISLYLSAGGGSLPAALAIHDAMRRSSCDVTTVATGLVGSAAAFLLASGTPGKRHALPHAAIHFHPTSGEISGAAPDLAVHLRHLLDLQERAYRLLAEYTGQAYEQIAQDLQRDRYFTAAEALGYGLIDRILRVRGAQSNGRGPMGPEGEVFQR